MVKEAEKIETLESREIDNYEKETKAFLDGGGLGDDFRPFRLQQGIYGQRQDDAQSDRNHTGAEEGGSHKQCTDANERPHQAGHP